MKLLSIIVPIYNVEPYIERCLRSLECQDIPKDEYEIICINDGSSDNSREVVIRLQREFDNIILIDKENQGVSRARNDGIEKATGKYILFIDPDDFVDTDQLRGILKKANQYNAQVMFLGFKFINIDGTIRKEVFNEKHAFQIYKGIKAYFVSRADGRTDPDRMWAILFDSNFLNTNDLRYLPDVPYLEDGEFIARILCLAERCIFDGSSFYNRTTRLGSATHSELFKLEKAAEGFLLAAGNLKKFQKERNLNDNQRKYLNQPIAKFVLLAINSSVHVRKSKFFVDTVKNLKMIGLKKIKLGGCNRLYTMLGFSYNISAYVSAFVLIIYPRISRFCQFFKLKFYNEYSILL